MMIRATVINRAKLHETMIQVNTHFGVVYLVTQPKHNIWLQTAGCKTPLALIQHAFFLLGGNLFFFFDLAPSTHNVPDVVNALPL